MANRTKRTPEKTAKVLEVIADGLTMSEAAAAAGIGRTALWQWRQEDAAFNTAFEQAFATGTDAREAKGRERAWDGDTALYIFLMKSRDPARFNRRMVEVGGTVAAPPIAIPEGCCTPRGAPSGISSLCGYVAERRVDRPDEIPPPEDFYRNRDKSDVQRAIARLGSDNNGDLLLAVWAKAQELVDTHWDSIVRLAEALEQRGSLSGDEVAALWRETSLAA